MPKHKGGLNIKEPEAHNLSMRIKHLLTLKQEENQPPWMHIAICWLGQDVYNYNKDYYHLKSNNILQTVKTALFYYRDQIYYIKTQSPNMPNQKNETKIIYKSILEEGSQKQTIFGEKQWKDKVTNLDF